MSTNHSTRRREKLVETLTALDSHLKPLNAKSTFETAIRQGKSTEDMAASLWGDKWTAADGEDLEEAVGPLVKRRLLFGGIKHIPHLLALNTPELWGRIWVELSHRKNLNDRQAQAAQTFLSRAARGNDRVLVPLSLKITGSIELLGILEPENMKCIYGLTASYPFQILDVTVPQSDLVQPLWELPNKLWSNVEELRLTCYCKGAEPTWPLLFSPDMELLNLKTSAVLRGAWTGFHPDAVVPWYQLRYLDIYPRMPLSTCLDILCKGVSLEHCSIEVGATTGSGTIVRHRMMLPNLGSLTLFFEDGGDTKSFIDMLTLPNLTTLRLDGIGRHLNCDTMTFVDLARRSDGMKHLSTLIMGECVSEFDVRLVLKRIPTLVHIVHDNYHWDFR
ncbi:hypothetical protein AX17_003242 [Amanita inopinata Kibby_2008]|nr:hypothetical protein AX17_003242 [Amanita inopinata Kibby_2008]